MHMVALHKHAYTCVRVVMVCGWELVIEQCLELMTAHFDDYRAVMEECLDESNMESCIQSGAHLLYMYSKFMPLTCIY